MTAWTRQLAIDQGLCPFGHPAHLDDQQLPFDIGPHRFCADGCGYIGPALYDAVLRIDWQTYSTNAVLFNELETFLNTMTRLIKP